MGDSSAASSSFAIEWRGAQIALKASNGKYVAQMMNSYLHADADEATEENGGVYSYELVNRPRLVLRRFAGGLRHRAVRQLDALPQDGRQVLPGRPERRVHPHGHQGGQVDPLGVLSCRGP